MGYIPTKQHEAWVRKQPANWRERSSKKWTTKFYNSKLWRTKSRKMLTKFPYCARCAEREIVKRGEVTDHVIPISKGGALLHNDNLESLCHSCHNAKSAKESKGVIEDWVEKKGYKYSKRMIKNKLK